MCAVAYTFHTCPSPPRHLLFLHGDRVYIYLFVKGFHRVLSLGFSYRKTTLAWQGPPSGALRSEVAMYGDLPDDCWPVVAPSHGILWTLAFSGRGGGAAPLGQGLVSAPQGKTACNRTKIHCNCQGKCVRAAQNGSILMYLPFM